MPEYSDYIEGLTSAGALDGSEIIGLSKGGAPRRTTAQDIANLGGGVGVDHWCGNYDLSVNVYPTTDGNGPAGAPADGDEYYITVGGTPPGSGFIPADSIIKKVSTGWRTI